MRSKKPLAGDVKNLFPNPRLLHPETHAMIVNVCRTFLKFYEEVGPEKAEAAGKRFQDRLRGQSTSTWQTEQELRQEIGGNPPTTRFDVLCGYAAFCIWQEKSRGEPHIVSTSAWLIYADDAWATRSGKGKTRTWSKQKHQAKRKSGR